MIIWSTKEFNYLRSFKNLGDYFSSKLWNSVLRLRRAIIHMQRFQDTFHTTYVVSETIFWQKHPLKCVPKANNMLMPPAPQSCPQLFHKDAFIQIKYNVIYSAFRKTFIEGTKQCSLFLECHKRLQQDYMYFYRILV